MDSITLTSTTDPLEAVQQALGIPPEQRATVAETPVEPPVETVVDPVETKPAAEAPVVDKVVETPAIEVSTAGDEDEDPDEGDEEIEVSAHKRKRPGSQAQARIAEVIRERNAARQASATQADELAALKRRVEELSAKPKEAEKTADAPADAKPVPTDFASYEDFTEAMVKWGAREVAREEVATGIRNTQQQGQHEHQQRLRQEAVKQYGERLVLTQARHEDFDTVVGRADIPLSDVMRDGMLHSPLGPEIAYYLGKNPAEAARIFELGNSVRAGIEIGAIQAKLETQIATETAEDAKPVQKKVKAVKAAVVDPPATTEPPAEAAPPTEHAPSQASAAAPEKKAPVVQKATSLPDPISPNNGGGASPTSVSMDQLSYQDYKAARNAEIRARQGLR